MSSSLVSKLSSLFDARFAVSYLAPAAVGAGAILVIAAVEKGVTQVAKAWREMEATPTISGGIAVVVTLVLLAYILQSMSTPLLEFWEGRHVPRRLERHARTAQARAAARLNHDVEKRDLGVSHSDRYFGYPHDPARLRPTQLGNAFAAAHEYPLEAYGLDGLLWWPRLMAVLPTEFRNRIDDAMVPVIGLLNLGTVLAVSGLGAGIVLLFSRAWFPFWAPPPVGLVMAWLCYRGAVGHAVTYGTLMRVAFDFHRLDILDHMCVRRPDNYRAEHALWARLNDWVFGFTPPGTGHCPSDPEWMKEPFAYATSETES